MDPLMTTAVVLAAGTTIWYLAVRGAGAGADVVMQMFRSPAELGWPVGVQEDDEFRWDWSRPPRPTPVLALPEIIELPPGSGPRPHPVERH